MSALISTSGTPPGGSHSDQPFQWTSLEICVCDVSRLDRETLTGSPRKENIQPFDVTGWRVRSHTSGFRQISTADQSTFEQRSNMRTTFASFMLVFCRCRPTEVESVCVLDPAIAPVRVPIRVFSVKMFPLVLVTHTAVSVKSDQRVCVIPLTILLSFDKFNSGLSSTTVVLVIGNRGSLICP